MGDPSDPLSLNRYVYCGLDPVNYIDPTGFMATEAAAMGLWELNGIPVWGTLAYCGIVAGIAIAEYGPMLIELGSKMYQTYESGGGNSSSSGRDPNFRKKLAKDTGQNPSNADAHHNLPVQFSNFFDSKGINLNNTTFGSWVDRVQHSGMSNEFNQDWASYIRNNSTASTEEILNFARDLASKYGVDANF